MFQKIALTKNIIYIPKYELPSAMTFSRTVLLKLKQTVDSFQQQRIEQMIKKENYMVFSTDGLDFRDVDRL